MYSWMVVASGISLLYSWLDKYLVSGNLRGVGQQTMRIAHAWKWRLLGVGIPKDFCTPLVSVLGYIAHGKGVGDFSMCS
jgi:hypothetical protein